MIELSQKVQQLEKKEEELVQQLKEKEPKAQKPPATEEEIENKDSYMGSLSYRNNVNQSAGVLTCLSSSLMNMPLKVPFLTKDAFVGKILETDDPKLGKTFRSIDDLNKKGNAAEAFKTFLDTLKRN